MYRYLLLISLLLFSACFVSKGAKGSKKKEKKATIEYGMRHEEVLSLVTDRSERMVAEFNYPEGHMVAYQYARYGRASMKQAPYYMYFLNDTLVRKAPSDEDLLKGSKLALAEHKDMLAERAEREERMAEQEEARAAKERQLEKRRQEKEERAAEEEAARAARAERMEKMRDEQRAARTEHLEKTREYQRDTRKKEEPVRKEKKKKKRTYSDIDDTE